MAARTTRRRRRPVDRGGIGPLVSVPRLSGTSTPVQVGAVVVSQGGPREEEPLAGIIGLASCESGFNTNATSRNPDGGTNRGWWQIDDKAHPEFGRDCLHDPVCGTRAMLKISNGGTDFSAWACKLNPTAEFRRAAQEALKTSPSVSPTDTSGGGTVLDKLGQLVDISEAIGKFFTGLGELLLTPEGWVRLGKLLLGAIVLVWGLAKLAGMFGGGKAARSARRAAAMLPTGRVAGAAAKAVA